MVRLTHPPCYFLVGLARGFHLSAGHFLFLKESKQMSRTARRAAAHKARKAAEKALRLQAAHQPTAAAPVETVRTEFPEPGAPLPSLAEITPARLAANRENALKSCGPKSEEGKAISSQNRFKHGLARHNGRFAVLPTEDADAFAELLDNYLAEHELTTQTETDLVHAMAESLWLRNRAQNLQPSCFDPNSGAVIDQKSLTLYIRYENQYTRAHSTALKQVLNIRSGQRKAAIGFEAQKRAEEKHQMKKDAHYWDVLKKDAQACHELARNLIQKMDAVKQIPDFSAQLEAELAKYNAKKGTFNVAIAA
jgi:hypothetical protein